MERFVELAGDMGLYVILDAENLAMEVKELLKRASINLYMFQGGTYFGFYNGCSARGYTDLPQITSYNYDAILTGWGEPAAIGEHYHLRTGLTMRRLSDWRYGEADGSCLLMRAILTVQCKGRGIIPRSFPLL